MTPQITAAGLRAYADFVEQHPEVPFETSFTVYGVKVETIHNILQSLPSATVRVEQAHDICYIEGCFGSVPVQFVVKRDKIAMPTIQGGKVVWVVKPEFEAVTA